MSDTPSFSTALLVGLGGAAVVGFAMWALGREDRPRFEAATKLGSTGFGRYAAKYPGQDPQALLFEWEVLQKIPDPDYEFPPDQRVYEAVKALEKKGLVTIRHAGGYREYVVTRAARAFLPGGRLLSVCDRKPGQHPREIIGQLPREIQNFYYDNHLENTICGVKNVTQNGRVVKTTVFSLRGSPDGKVFLHTEQFVRDTGVKKRRGEPRTGMALPSGVDEDFFRWNFSQAFEKEIDSEEVKSSGLYPPPETEYERIERLYQEHAEHEKKFQKKVGEYLEKHGATKVKSKKLKVALERLRYRLHVKGHRYAKVPTRMPGVSQEFESAPARPPWEITEPTPWVRPPEAQEDPFSWLQTKAEKAEKQRAEYKAETEQALKEFGQEAVWEEPDSAFTLYDASRTYEEDDLLLHPTWGKGVVLYVIDPGQMQVFFRDKKTLRVLAHGKPEVEEARKRAVEEIARKEDERRREEARKVAEEAARKAAEEEARRRAEEEAKRNKVEEENARRAEAKRRAEEEAQKVAAGFAGEAIADFREFLKGMFKGTAAERRKTYRQLVMKYHPDRVPESQRALANERLKEINKAYAASRRELGLLAFQLGDRWNFEEPGRVQA